MNITKKMFAGLAMPVCLILGGCFSSSNKELVGVWVSECGYYVFEITNNKLCGLDDNGKRLYCHDYKLEGETLSIPALDTLEECTGSFTFENGILYHHAEGETTELIKKR